MLLDILAGLVPYHLRFCRSSARAVSFLDDYPRASIVHRFELCVMRELGFPMQRTFNICRGVR
jgi:hypothetical protein